MTVVTFSKTAVHAHIRIRMSALLKMNIKPTSSKAQLIGEIFHVPFVPQRRPVQPCCEQSYRSFMGTLACSEVQMFSAYIAVHAQSWRCAVAKPWVMHSRQFIMQRKQGRSSNGEDTHNHTSNNTRIHANHIREYLLYTYNKFSSWLQRHGSIFQTGGGEREAFTCISRYLMNAHSIFIGRKIQAIHSPQNQTYNLPSRSDDWTWG